ncbi:MAG: hypothetical protein IH628_03890 [Proteobacteria bacterium]|nr:hypothetical protein [Pseudomonadota bacterium]
MKKKLMVLALAAVFAVTLAGEAMAGKGKGGGNGVGNGTGPIHDILAGTAFEYTGTVVEFLLGEGMLISTADGNVVIYGIGPVRYWESLGVDRPAVGEDVSVAGYNVNYNEEYRNIAVTMTVGENTVELRDPDTGLPLWRQGGPRQR